MDDGGKRKMRTDKEVFVEVVQGMLNEHRLAVLKDLDKEMLLTGEGMATSTAFIMQYERRMLERMFEEAKTSPALKNYLGMAMMALRSMAK
jgi:hypothetical protein